MRSRVKKYSGHPKKLSAHAVCKVLAMIPVKVREAVPQEKILDWAGWTVLHIHKNLLFFLSVSQPDLQILGPWCTVSISQTHYQPLEKKMSREHGQNWKCKRKDWQPWKFAFWLPSSNRSGFVSFSFKGGIRHHCCIWRTQCNLFKFKVFLE